jgi:hypothetical protein
VANTILHKFSSTAAATPLAAALELRELALNTTDGRLFTKTVAGSVVEFARKDLTGFLSGAGTVAATDTILQAVNKLDGNTLLRAPRASPTFTGIATAPTVYAKSAVASTGWASLQPGTVTRSGYLESIGYNGVRQGYVGNSTTAAVLDQGELQYVAKRHNFVGSAVVYGGAALIILGVPGQATGAPSVTGGTIPAGTTYARISACDVNGALTTAGVQSAAVTTTGTTSSIVWTWTAVASATQYLVYVGATGAQGNYFTSTTNSFKQTLPSASGTASAPATTNQTGSLDVPGDIDCAYVAMSHAASGATTDTVFYSSADNKIRKNNATGLKTSLALNNVTNESKATMFTAPVFTGAVTGSVAAMTGLTSSQVTTALGYTPGSSAGLSASVILTNTTAVAGSVYVLTASLTLTLPASPSAGNTVTFSNMSGTRTSILARNGQNIMGSATDMTIDILNTGQQLMFADATRGWVIL